ncbi:MAG: lipid-binding SYLF domain-containing protein [Defluviicoccus sp.]|nr:lipid-binding SYLF domain-containing protein [Defluviicoccus sp.]MDE0386765.1 lipid-binding SYLF domain-containing protein [Defluviicoccus sp.]
MLACLTSRNAAAAGLTAALMTIAAVPAEAASTPQALVDNARYTVEKMLRNPETKPFAGLLRRAQAVLIVPSLIKASFLIGGEGGSGVLLARDREGRWSNPAFYDIGAGSIGLQFGFQDSEVVFLIMSRRTLEAMLQAKLKLGADASIAAGPFGVGYEGATALNLRADIYSYALSRGAFFGASFEGSVTVEDRDRNRAYYGPGATARAIVVQRRFANPGAAQLLRALGAP